MLLSPIAHARCQDCHRDPHEGRLGADCEGCHGETSWRAPRIAGRLTDFHDRTEFPLRDAHRKVECPRCHPRDRMGARVLRPIPHERCSDCHADAHPDRAALPATERRCEQCHDGVAFQPARYGLKEHADSRFPLQGAHEQVACPACHAKRMVPSPAPPPPDAPRRSGWALRSPWRAEPAVCSDCHPDPHRGQLSERTCEQCHGPDGWSVKGRFDHDVAPSRFALKGKHREVACERCHPKESDGDGSFVRYRPLPLTCDECHQDQHLGQLRLLAPPRRCPECHNEEGFKPAHFDHKDPLRTRFPLRGAHEKAECPSCHPSLELTPGVSTAHYRPLPLRCDRCHADPHEGRHQSMAPLVADGAGAGSPSGLAAGPSTALIAGPIAGPPLPPTAGPVSKPAPSPQATRWESPPAPAGPRTDCARCHNEQAWWPASFEHNATGFPLTGLHEGLPCEECHAEPAGPNPPRDCAGCHADVHGATLGANCGRCHDATGFVDVWRARAEHDRTRMPLQGPHASLPCVECHQDLRTLGFVGTPLACEACHLGDRPASGDGLDHEAPGFSLRCRECHIAANWRIASLRAHDRCFPILSGAHAFVPCRQCHRGQLPAAVDQCTTGRFSCSGCHGCGEHEGVAGYQCKERKCYECHPDGEE